MTEGIPDQLSDHDLLKIYGPEADCGHPGKQPIGSARTGPFYHAEDPELVRHIEDGGNVGFPLNGPFVVFDIDHADFEDVLDRKLPPTFSVRTGSGGKHEYYHAPGWSDDRQLNIDGTDYGSIRSDGWQVVIPPSVHPDTGDRYRVETDRQIKSIAVHEIEAVLDAVGDSVSTSQHSGGGGSGGGSAAAAGCAGGSSGPSLPDEYPNREADWGTLRSWLSANDILKDLNRSTGDRSAREFKIAKCLAEGGFAESAISNVLDRLPHDSKWHERGSDYQTRTVRNAIVAAVEDPYVEFDVPAYKPQTGERRKTESGAMNPGKTGGDTNMPEFTDKLEVPILEGSDDGDSFKKIVLVEGNDDGDTFEYLALKKGRVQNAKSANGGDSVLVESVDDSVSLGSPDYLDDLVDGLQEMQEQLDK